MRRAAGIIMIILGMLSLVLFGSLLIHMDANDVLVRAPFIVLCASVVAGGVFCIQRRYWKVCFVSALLLFCFQIYSLVVGDWLAWLYTVYCPVGVLPAIFVGLRKRDWQKSQA